MALGVCARHCYAVARHLAGSPSFTYAIGTMNSGSTATVTVTYTVPASATASPQVNSVSVCATKPDPIATNNTATDSNSVIALADLSVTKDDGDGDEDADDFEATTVVAGQDSITYSLSVTNHGPSDAAGRGRHRRAAGWRDLRVAPRPAAPTPR